VVADCVEPGTMRPGLPSIVPTLLITVCGGAVADRDAMLKDLKSICAQHEVELAVELCIADGVMSATVQS
jgi:hypothetical protein